MGAAIMPMPPPGLSSTKCPSTVVQNDSEFPRLLDRLHQAENGIVITRGPPSASPKASVKHVREPADSTIRITRIPEGAVSRTRADWTVGQVQAKLKASSGFPLVSPTFTITGLPSLRLM